MFMNTLETEKKRCRKKKKHLLREAPDHKRTENSLVIKLVINYNEHYLQPHDQQ